MLFKSKIASFKADPKAGFICSEGKDYFDHFKEVQGGIEQLPSVVRIDALLDGSFLSHRTKPLSSSVNEKVQNETLSINLG